MSEIDDILDNVSTLQNLQACLMSIDNSLTNLKYIRSHFAVGGHYFTKEEEDEIVRRLTRLKKKTMREVEKIKVGQL